jgi:hypothetical protein
VTINDPPKTTVAAAPAAWKLDIERDEGSE